MLKSGFSRVFDVSFKINERESNLFAKLDTSRVTRLLRASNLASNSSVFENGSVSLLSRDGDICMNMRSVFFKSKIFR